MDRLIKLKICRKKSSPAWMDGWVDGWVVVGGSNSWFKDCFQKSKSLLCKHYVQELDFTRRKKSRFLGALPALIGQNFGRPSFLSEICPVNEIGGPCLTPWPPNENSWSSLLFWLNYFWGRLYQN